MVKKILIAGGGTGGHVFPAISIARALRDADPQVEILFVGAKNKLEMEKVPEAGFSIEGLPVTGFQRRITYKNLLFFIHLWKSMRKSAQLIRKFKPDVAVGVGGYASGPALKAASRRNIPVVIQEQNSYAGVTNKILSKTAAKIFVAYEGMDRFFPGKKILLTGNPVRKDIVKTIINQQEARKAFGLKQDQPVILVLGGSLGARSINNGIGNSLDLLGEKIQLLWQTGKFYYNSIIEDMGEKAGENVKIYPFLNDMNRAYAAADIIVSRAGAGTISELALVGKPVILVPSPNVAEDHQTKNALALVNKGAAWMIKDSEAPEILGNKCLELIRDHEKCEILSRGIAGFAIPDAAEIIAKEILSVE